MKRKHSEAAHAKQDLRNAYLKSHNRDEAEETRNWFDEWAARPAPEQEQEEKAEFQQ